jgi:hypothetical protein
LYELSLFHCGPHSHPASLHAGRTGHIGTDCWQRRDQSRCHSASAGIAPEGEVSRVEGGAWWRLGARAKASVNKAKRGKRCAGRRSHFSNASERSFSKLRGWPECSTGLGGRVSGCGESHHALSSNSDYPGFAHRSKSLLRESRSRQEVIAMLLQKKCS